MISVQADPIEHRVECPEPSLHEFVGRLGDLVTRCHNCGRVAVQGPSGDAVIPGALTIPPRPGPARTGASWPTHRARRRNARRRYLMRETR